MADSAKEKARGGRYCVAEDPNNKDLKTVVKPLREFIECISFLHSKKSASVNKTIDLSITSQEGISQ